MNNTQSTHTKFNIEEGYEVRDFNGDEFGTVKSVHYYTDEPLVSSDVVVAPAALGYAMPLATPYGAVFANLPDLPEEHRDYLHETGFVRIGRGLFNSDMLASFNQISHVSNECVYLSVAQDDLIKV